MAINVNTNSIGLLARNNFSKSVYSLSETIEKLSSGLRISNPADDSVSFTLANRLNSQALALGQAASNANDALSISQIIDNSTAESIDILNSIKTKVVQAGQSLTSSSTRESLQDDIQKLLEDMEFIAFNTKFNDQLLLTGHFINKWFQVGEAPDTSLPISMPDAHESKLGLMQSAELSLTSTGGDVNISFTNPGTDKTLSLKGISISYNNKAADGFGGLADLINSYKSETGVSAQAIVESTSAGSITSGATSSSFSINDITIGSVTVTASDSSGKLVSAINGKTTEHGVTASTSSEGKLSLKASDGRPIEVKGLDAGVGATDTEMSTYGYAKIFQHGPYKLNMTDSSNGFAVAFSSNVSIGSIISTTADSQLAPDSVLGGGSTLEAGWEAGVTVSGTNLNGNIVTTESSTLLAGSALASGSIIEKNSVLGGSGSNDSQITTTANTLVQSDSVLLTGTVLASGTYLTNDITTASGTTTKGAILDGDATLTSNLTLTSDMMLLGGSVIASGSTFTAGSFIGEDFTLSGSMTMTKDMPLLAGSTIIDTDAVTVISKGSTVGGASVLAATDLTVEQSMKVPSGSTLSTSTQLATGSSIGGAALVSGNNTAAYDIYLASGSILASTSVLNSGTVLTNTIQTTSGSQSNGTTLSKDYTTNGINNITNAMTIKAGSIVSDGSTLAPNTYSEANFAISEESQVSLWHIDVLTLNDAEASLEIVDAALSDLNDISDEAAALQGQFESVASALNTTKSNLLDARSSILDIDFTEEVENMTRMQILVNAGSFSLTQANAIPGNVFNIIQGGTSQSSSDFFFSVML